MRSLLSALTIAALASPAFTAPLEDLVEEKARAVYASQLPQDGVFAITLKSTPDADVAVLAEFWMDPATGQFLTNAVLATGDVQRLSGTALVTVPVPVPNRRLLPGDILAESDLRIEQMPLGRVSGYATIELDTLIGKEVRRLLPEGRPIQAQSVIEPRVVGRGDTVKIMFDDGTLALSAPGRALSDAHAGQDLRVVNLVSNKTLTAIATGDGIVEIAR